MKEPDYSIRTISIDEVQQLLKKSGQSVFLVLYQSDAPVPFEETRTLPPPEPTAFDAAAAMTNDVNTWELMLANYLHQLGIPAHIKGYEYIKKAIEFAMADPSILRAITKELYPDIAKSCGTTPSRVERAIRHAIETAWNRGSMQLQDDLFGTTINSLKGKPTNGEFIAMIAEKFRLHQVEPPV